VGLIVGIIAAVIILPIVLLFGIGVVIGITAALHAHPATPRGPARLTESYPLKNGLAVVHYPADFAAKSLDRATLIVSRNLSDGTDEVVQVAAVPNPISDDVNEFSRILIGLMAKKIENAGDEWTETARHHRACFKTFPGLEVEGTFTAGGIMKENVHICFFMGSNRGYEIKTVVPAIHESEELPTLQSIVNATELR